MHITWAVLELFEKTKNPEEICLVDTKLATPLGVKEKVKEIWNKQLEGRKKALEKEGIFTHIQRYAESPEWNALYEKNSLKMWPGPVISLQKIKQGDKLELHVSETIFPLIQALSNPEIIKIYDSAQIPLPRPALGISCLVLTSDKKILFTLRGQATPLYPGRLYTSGGQPTSTETSILDHQASEIKEEILLSPSEWSGMCFGGITIDKEDLPGKPDLTGWVKTSLTSKEIKSRVMSIPFNERPTDAIDVEFAPNGEKELFDYLVNTPSSKFCPPTQASLAIYGFHTYGKEWYHSLIKKIAK
ncbi:MAG: hypothetical protein ACP5NS_02250 [Candidatus Pacearchaeota archaeon]